MTSTPAMPSSIRDARPEDAGAIATIARAGWTEAYDGLLDPAFLARRAASDLEAEWRAYLGARPSAHGLLVAEERGRVVGFVRFGPAGNAGVDATAADTAEIYGFYVAPDHVGQKIGRRLFAAAREALAARGFRDLALWTFTGNRRAERFYARAGLALDGAVRREDESGAKERRWRVRHRRDFGA